MIIAYIGLTIGKRVVLYDEEWNQVGREIEIK